MSVHPRVRVASLGGGAKGDAVQIDGEAAHHLARVIRVRAGDAVTLFDGAGREALARVLAVSGRGEAVVDAALEADAHAGVGADASGVIWLQGVPKGDKLDAIVRQATELGVSALWPVYTARSVSRPTPTGGARGRAERLRAIARSASAQCGRADEPEVREAVMLAEALSEIPAAAMLRIVPWEQGGEPLGTVLARAPREGPCAVLVGPEGGLADTEVATARAHGFVPVSLGPRILRTETVAPALLGMLSLARGDLAKSG